MDWKEKQKLQQWREEANVEEGELCLDRLEVIASERDQLARDVTAAHHAIDRLVSQFEGIADGKWPTEGMRIAVKLCAEWARGAEGAEHVAKARQRIERAQGKLNRAIPADRQAIKLLNEAKVELNLAEGKEPYDGLDGFTSSPHDENGDDDEA